MKKLVFSAAFLCATVVSFAQDLYIKPYLGYGVGYPGETNYEVTQDTAEANYNHKAVQMGGGPRGGVSFGLLLDDGFGFDFDLSYQNNLGQEFTDVSESYEFDPMTGNFNQVTETDVYAVSSYSIRFTPSLHFELDRDGIKPFIDLGPTFMYSAFDTEVEMESSFGDIVSVEEFSSRITMGASGNLGVEFEIADDIFLSTALRFTMAQTNPSKSEITTYTIDGEDQLKDWDTSDKEFIYEKDFTRDFSDSDDPDEPTVLPAQRLDYSSVALIAGVKILLN